MPHDIQSGEYVRVIHPCCMVRFQRRKSAILLIKGETTSTKELLKSGLSAQGLTLYLYTTAAQWFVTQYRR